MEQNNLFLVSLAFASVIGKWSRVNDSGKRYNYKATTAEI